MAEATSPIDPSQTLGFLLAAFLRSRKLKGRRQGTIDAYTLAARELHDYLLKELDADNIQLADRRVIEDFLIDYMVGRSTTTANKTFRQLRAWFNWMWKEDLIATNPFQGRKRVEAPQVQYRAKAGFTTPEAKAIIRNAEEDIFESGELGWRGVRDRAILLVLYDTGLRATEVIMMTIEGLSLNTGLFEVPGKGGKFHRRHLGAASIEAIKRYLRRLHAVGISSGTLWRNHAGYNLTRSGLYRMCMRRATAAGVMDGNPHRWRYTHGEILEDLGWPEEIIMAEMGHSTLSVSRHYRESAIRRKALKQHEQQSPADLLVQ